MKVEVRIPLIQTSLDNLKNCLPDIKKLEEMANESPLKKGATRRVIRISIDNDKLEGYDIEDWNEEKYLGFKSYPS